jgi:predicted amidohydrolase YtcJ
MRGVTPLSAITIFQARRIVTMNPSRPEATHVAVQDGRILCTGTSDEMACWGDARLDDRLRDAVLLPGFVEGHSHVSEGAFWRLPYVGYHDRMDPDGRTWPGLRSLDAVIARLAQAHAAHPDAAAPLIAWGFDPIYFADGSCSRHDLDQVSRERVVVILHASGHILSVNSAALAAVSWLRRGVDHPGIALGPDGLPLGELKGPEAMTPLLVRCGLDREALADEDALRRFARLCVRTGTTTATDLLNTLTPATVETMLRTTGDDAFPARIVPFLRLVGEPVPETVARAVALRAQSTDRLRLGRVKMVIDGSIQGFSARLRWPGYHNGAPNGLWYTAPEQLRAALEAALRADVLVHLHTNGDQATELVLDTLRAVLRERPSPDHRFTLQHCQLADAAQFRRMKALGMCVNLFANHTFFWGEQHRALTVGPERAARMNACATALACGVPLAIHSDAPVTPLGPLFTAWCAVNRLTSSGRELGAHERIGVADALRAITLGAAYTLGLDGEVGSIEAGKRADFAVLEDDPLAVPPASLRDVRVRGTVLGGRVFEAGG